MFFIANIQKNYKNIVGLNILIFIGFVAKFINNEYLSQKKTGP